MPKPLFVTGPHNILLYGSVIGFAWFAYSLWLAFTTGLTAQVLSQETVCSQPLNNRCHYEHKVRLPDGTTTTIALKGYVFTLEDLAAGNTIDKKPFALGYSVNGEHRTWSYAPQFFLLLATSLFTLLAWASPRIRTNMKRVLG